MSVDHITASDETVYFVNFVANNNLVNGSADMDAYLLEPARELVERPTICSVIYYVAELSAVKNMQ